MSVQRVLRLVGGFPSVGRIISCRDLPLEARRFAGHSHWQNVKHTKDANDKLKSKASSYYYRAVQTAIKGMLSIAELIS